MCRLQGSKSHANLTTPAKKKKKKSISNDFWLTEESLTLLCMFPEKVSSPSLQHLTDLLNSQ